jgi:hypothetical protein
MQKQSGKLTRIPWAYTPESFRPFAYPSPFGDTQNGLSRLRGWGLLIVDHPDLVVVPPALGDFLFPHGNIVVGILFSIREHVIIQLLIVKAGGRDLGDPAEIRKRGKTQRHGRLGLDWMTENARWKNGQSGANGREDMVPALKCLEKLVACTPHEVPVRVQQRPGSQG